MFNLLSSRRSVFYLGRVFSSIVPVRPPIIAKASLVFMYVLGLFDV